MQHNEGGPFDERFGPDGASPARLALLLDASTAVGRAPSLRDALRGLAEEAVPRLADLCLIDVISENGDIERLAAVHHDPAKRGLVEILQRDYSPAPDGHHPVAAVLHSRKSVWSDTVSPEFLRLITRDDRHHEIVTELGFESYMSVPLKAGDDLIGVMTLVAAGSGRRFQEADLALPEELADRVSELAREVRGHDRDRSIARALQARLLPKRFPVIRGVEVAHRYFTGAPDIDVGGDFYDVVVLPSGRIGLAVGDVAGHDPDAAALMGQLRSAIRALAGQLREPRPLVEALQWSWELLGFDRICTLLVGRLDLERGLLTCVSAGHPPPVLITPDGRVGFVPVTPGPPLGAAADAGPEVAVPVEEGGTLVLYTDGLVEERGDSLGAGLDRLLESCRTVGALPPERMVDALIDRQLADRALQDDLAVLVLKITGA